MAQNALGIVRRELATRPDPHDKALSDALLAGETTLATPGLLARLRRAALDTCTADTVKIKKVTFRFISDPAAQVAALLAGALVTGFLATITVRGFASTRLDASTGTSGPHDFTVRKSHARQS